MALSFGYISNVHLSIRQTFTLQHMNLKQIYYMPEGSKKLLCKFMFHSYDINKIVHIYIMLPTL